jgi:hypothetical protein
VDLNINLTDIAAFASIATPIGLFFLVRQIKINRQQLQLQAITRCIDEFRKLEGLGRQAEAGTTIRYVDLVNEELFYLQHRYLPKEIGREWIDGMIDFMPITNPGGALLNSPYCLLYLEKKPDVYLQGYSRVKNAFSVNDTYNWEIVYNEDAAMQTQRAEERKRLVTEIYENAMRYEF